MVTVPHSRIEPISFENEAEEGGGENEENEGDEEALSEAKMEGNKEKGRERIDDRNMFEIYG